MPLFFCGENSCYAYMEQRFEDAIRQGEKFLSL